MTTAISNSAGSYTLPGATVSVCRMGYGAMQLAGPGVYGPPKDRDEAIAVLREAIASGVNHIDTSDFYGPHITNEIIKGALSPYSNDLVIVTKVGYRRDDKKAWLPASSPEALESAIHDNLRNLGLESLEVVNLRVGGPMGPSEAPIANPLTVLVGLKEKGLIKNIGLSNITPKQFAEGRSITDIVCVQNQYNLAERADDAFIDELAGLGVAYVPFFPLGGFSQLQSTTLSSVAASLGATPMQVALAWLLQRSPNILLIPGTSTVEHLRENLAAAELKLSPEAVAELDTIGAAKS
ncbi:pyridoxine 4-dehydrogenase [soil metagenome]